MDIKELGIGAVVIIGGVAYTVGGGLGDALDEDVKYISEVSYDNRSVYMGEIVDKFSDTFSGFIIQTETYDYVGNAMFSYTANSGTFELVVSSEETVSRKDKKDLKTELKSVDICSQADFELFTDKGWKYSFEMNDNQGGLIYNITCRPIDKGVPELRLSS